MATHEHPAPQASDPRPPRRRAGTPPLAGTAGGLGEVSTTSVRVGSWSAISRWHPTASRSSATLEAADLPHPDGAGEGRS